MTGREISAQRLTALLEVLDFRTVLRRPNERDRMNRLFGQIQIETVRKIKKFFFVQLFLLVRDVLAFARFTEPVAFHGHRQNDGGLAFVLDRALVRVIDLTGSWPPRWSRASCSSVLSSTSLSSSGYLPKNS